MEETVISNRQKCENYKEQFKRLNKALSGGFYLEAMFIEYAILEDRTESVLRHGGFWDAYVKHQRGRGPSINSKIKYIQALADKKVPLFHKFFSDNLLDDVLDWKESRNCLIHALLKQEFYHNEVMELAQQGKTLTDILRTRTGNFNRATERQEARR